MYIHFWLSYNAFPLWSSQFISVKSQFIVKLNIQIYTKRTNIMYILLMLNPLAIVWSPLSCTKQLKHCKIIYNFTNSPFLPNIFIMDPALWRKYIFYFAIAPKNYLQFHKFAFSSKHFHYGSSTVAEIYFLFCNCSKKLSLCVFFSVSKQRLIFQC